MLTFPLGGSGGDVVVVGSVVGAAVAAVVLGPDVPEPEWGWRCQSTNQEMKTGDENRLPELQC